MRILLTSSGFFLGSHLSERLLNEGHEVTWRRQNVAHLIGNPYFEILRHDICFPLYAKVDEIYNLGWEPKTPFEDGLRGTIKYFKSIL